VTSPAGGDSADDEQTALLIREIWEQERDGVLSGVGVLEEAIAAALDDALDDELRQRARREAHKLAGSIGTFGFWKASENARELELTFERPAEPALQEVPHLAELALAIRAEKRNRMRYRTKRGIADGAPQGGGAPSSPTRPV